MENKIKIGDIVLIENRRGQVAKIKIQGSNTRILCLIGDERKIVFSKELEWNKITSLWKYKKGEK